MQTVRWTLSILVSLLPLTAACQEFHFKSSLNLNAILESPKKLKEFEVSYLYENRVFFLFGDGRVIVQTRSPFRPMSLVPTCTATASSDKVKSIVRLLIGKKFFDLASRNFMVQDTESLQAAQIHTINVVFATDVASRSFAAGIYNDAQQTIPAEFIEVEKGLRELETALIVGKACHVAAPVGLKMALLEIE